MPDIRRLQDSYSIPGGSRPGLLRPRAICEQDLRAEIVHGEIAEDKLLEITSHMPQNGVIFSDGVEEDRLDFNSGAIAHRPG